MGYYIIVNILGPLAQLARVLPWHGRGQGFESLMVHKKRGFKASFLFCRDYRGQKIIK